MMLDNNTVSKLHEMKLSVMATAFQKQLADLHISEMTFEERFGLLADAEWTARKNNHLKRLIKNADYAFPNACLEDIEYHADRQLDKALIVRLETCNVVMIQCGNEKESRKPDGFIGALPRTLRFNALVFQGGW